MFSLNVSGKSKVSRQQYRRRKTGNCRNTDDALTGSNLVQLANVHELSFIDVAFEDDKLKSIIQYYAINPQEMEKELHIYAKNYWQLICVASLAGIAGVKLMCCQ